MNQFIQHLPCPKCGSKDNLGEYTENYYCFGCGHFENKRSLSRVNAAFSQEVAPYNSNLSLTSVLPQEAKEWLIKYQLTPKEWENFRWCADKSLLILYHDAQYWQGRIFAPDTKAKYLSEGIKPFILYGVNLDKIVLVEDILSAIKVSRVASASPMLGTMPLERNLSHLEPFNSVYLWCDKDARIKSLKTARNLSEKIGKRVIPVISEKDPKCYNDNDIVSYLR